MPYVVTRDLTKLYGDVPAVRGVSLTVEQREFVSLVGPSGCGKTTLLRMIAGLIDPTTGEIEIDGRLLSGGGVSVPPEQRNLGMVFQSYAVWPHMNVFNNVAYPLRVKGQDRGNLRDKVGRFLTLVRLEEYASRMPYELSGGQQQRVALARALAMEPAVLLLDEPLSNLDAKLREEMRYELKDLQRRLQITIIYVTHDQAEAMAMSDRVAVMREGLVEQVGTPRQIYRNPATRFVANFIGQANFVDGVVTEREGNRALVDAGYDGLLQCLTDHPVKSRVTLAVRPEDVNVARAGEMPGTFRATIEAVTFLGSRTEYHIRAGDRLVRAEQPGVTDLKEGDLVDVRFNRCSALKEPLS